MIVVKIALGYFAIVIPLAVFVGDVLHHAADATSSEVPECAFGWVSPVTLDELPADDQGALEPHEVGYVGHCRCGWKSRVRYSRVSAKNAVAGHILHRSDHAMQLGRSAAASSRVAEHVALRPPLSARDDGTAGTDAVGKHSSDRGVLAGPGSAVPRSSEPTR